jgi:hypothetical protein
VATDPVPVATGAVTLALVMLGLRTLFGSIVGRDHVITHITGRLIPAVFLTLAYPVLVARGVQLLNAAAGAIGTRAAMSTLIEHPEVVAVGADPVMMALWVVLVWHGLRLLLRLTYSLVRFVVALVFGPLALIMWAIPQTEWVTGFWLRELIGWGTTPLLVAVCLSIAIPMATGRSGFLAAAGFGLAGFMAAYDLVGLLALSHGTARGPIPLGYLRIAATAARGGTPEVAQTTPAVRSSILADMYGYM